MRFIRLLRRVIKALGPAFAKLDSRENIKFSSGLWFRVPLLKVTVVAVGPDVFINVDLSIDETRSIFRSIKSAMDDCDVKTVKLRDLTWITDARVKTRHPEYMTMRFRRWSRLQFSSDMVKRDDVVKALDEFSKKFDVI